MGTRCGSIDPSVIPYIMEKTGMTTAQITTAINKESGLVGISGVSSDARDIWHVIGQGNKRAKLAIDVLVHNIKKVVGGYIAELNGIDVLVFTAGLGENDERVRQMVADDMEALGISVDKDANFNFKRGVISDISAKDSKVKVLVIPTDEEYMIALDTAALVK